jgi:tetratricopeptide (TPR) repeat protein
LAFVTGDCEGGVALIDRALVLNPNLASAWNASGWVRTFLGEADTGIEHLARAMRLSPLDPLMFMMHHVTGLAHFVAGRYVEALSWARLALRENPDFLATLRLAAASAVLLGDLEQAKSAIAHARELDPALLVSPKSPTWIAMLIEDLVRRYGLKKSVEWSPLYKLNRLCHVGGVGPQTPAASLHCTLAFSMT